MRKFLAMGITLACLASFVPRGVWAFPFGGTINQIVFCYNNAIYTNVGPPRGGPFIWSPSTKTYRFGPPIRSGQKLLGLVAPPYYCVVSREPIEVWAGILMTMMGSSGPSAPAYQPSAPVSAPTTITIPPPCDGTNANNCSVIN